MLEKNLNLNVDIEKGLIGLVDKNRIRQVMINLIDNAVKYTPAGGKISINVARKEAGVFIEVADTGYGIPKEHLDMIFERFYKVGEHKGTGIGLSISKIIVEAHDGKIWVESEKEKGTKFFIEIPKE
jgi:two-component system phosphate regulon sensor histidine kinase PhoR